MCIRDSSHTVGIITEDLTVFNTPEIVDGIESYCEEHGFEIVLANMRLFKRYDNNPVSYTHLDVYKRQQEGAASASGSWEETVSLVLFGVGLLLFRALVLFLARSVRRSRPAPPVLPGFLCRVSTPVGFADLSRDYFVVFPSGRSPISFWYPQTGGIAETERCFWVYPPNLPPLPLPKDSFLAGSPERLRELLPAINRKAEGQG